jgi:hypothetical protein
MVTCSLIGTSERWSEPGPVDSGAQSVMIADAPPAPPAADPDAKIVAMYVLGVAPGGQ